ncbi:MAG: hypothetical protein ABI702_22105 [Burkholderiales bacterium]
MFGQSRPVVLNRYGRRSRWSMPRWLVLLLTGIAIGAAGVIVVQERYLPPRLSAAESTELHQSFEQADKDRTRLKAELADTTKKLTATLDEKKRLTSDLTASRDTAAGLRQVASSLVSALPPDPRGGAVEVRAARFTVEGGALVYDLVLTRDRGTNKPLNGVLQLSVSGTSERGVDATAALKPIPVTIGAFESLRGSAPMPDGFKARQATVNVLDAPGGHALGKRVMYVK